MRAAKEGVMSRAGLLKTTTLLAACADGGLEDLCGGEGINHGRAAGCLENVRGHGKLVEIQVERG
jgi:hypothetical protein